MMHTTSWPPRTDPNPGARTVYDADIFKCRLQPSNAQRQKTTIFTSSWMKMKGKKLHIPQYHHVPTLFHSCIKHSHRLSRNPTGMNACRRQQKWDFFQIHLQDYSTMIIWKLQTLVLDHFKPHFQVIIEDSLPQLPMQTLFRSVWLISAAANFTVVMQCSRLLLTNFTAEVQVSLVDQGNAQTMEFVHKRPHFISS